MGMTLGNISVKSETTKTKGLLKNTYKGYVTFYVAEGNNNFTDIFPSDESFELMSPLTKRMSLDLHTVSVCCEIYDSDSIHFACYKDGKVVYEYEWYEEKTPKVTGTLENLFAAFEIKPFPNTIAELLETKFTFAEDRYTDFIKALGLSYALRQTGFDYIQRDASRAGGISKYNLNPENLKVELISSS